MKAYVIKNKEGKYFDRKERVFCELDYVCCEHIYDFIDDAKCDIDCKKLKDCEVVEITIAEGDLEKQLAEKDNEIDNLKELRKFEVEDKKELRENRLQEVIKLEKELEKKDKEIEELKTRISELQDKDWYEACIKQLEEQNDKLIKERDALQSKVSNEEINSTGIIPKPKFNIGSTVIAKTINCIVVIEDRYYDNNSNKWLYKFHAPSSVMDYDYYSTYSEDYLDEIEKGE